MKIGWNIFIKAKNTSFVRNYWTGGERWGSYFFFNIQKLKHVWGENGYNDCLKFISRYSWKRYIWIWLYSKYTILHRKNDEGPVY